MTQMDALLSLLSDPDPAVQESLLTKLSRDNELLDQAWIAAVARAAIPPILTDLVLRADAEALVDAFADADDLETGVWLLPRLDQPRHDYRSPGALALDHLAERMRSLQADADAQTVALFLCGACGFSGNRSSYDDPLNSFLPSVIERRVGLPIALTTLWLLITRRLHLEAEAIAMPGHVLGRWRGGYIDLFDGARSVTRDELDTRMRAMDEPSAMPYLAPASDRALLRRMARNLVHAYLKRGDKVRATIAHGLATA